MSEEDFLPQFPALHRALLLEPKQWSRTRSERELKGTRYFEHIMHSRTAENAAQLLREHEFDACFIGPTANKEDNQLVLREGVERGMSRDTAYVCMHFEGCDFVDELFEAGAHGLVEVPCSRPILRLAIVQAVVKANQNSPWTGISMKMDLSKFDPAALGKIKIVGQEAPSLNTDFVKLLKDSRDLLGKKLDELEQRGRLTDNNGVAKPETVVLIHELVEDMLDKNDRFKSIVGFGAFLEKALVTWTEDLLVFSKKEANDRLREKLVLFFTTGAGG